jgi:hypothetical protein
MRRPLITLVALLLLEPSAHAAWLRRLLTVGRMAQAVARREAAKLAIAEGQAQTRPDPAPYARAAERARACIEAPPPPAELDVAYVSKTRGQSLAQVLEECAALLQQAEAERVRVEAERQRRADVIRPLLKGDRLKIFDAEGEPDCSKCAGEAQAIARAREWTYVRGPSGPLATYETRTFVFRGDKLIERRQRISHEQP